MHVILLLVKFGRMKIVPTVHEDLRTNKSFTFKDLWHNVQETEPQIQIDSRWSFRGGQRSEVTVPSTLSWMKREMSGSRNTGAAEKSFFYFFTAGWRRRGRNWRREDDWGGRRRGREVLLEQMSFQPPTLRVTVRFWLEWEGHFSSEWAGRKRRGRTGPPNGWRKVKFYKLVAARSESRRVQEGVSSFSCRLWFTTEEQSLSSLTWLWILYRYQV